MNATDLTLTRWGDPHIAPAWLEDGADIPADLEHAWIVLPAGDEARARALLAAGAAGVLLGDAALLDSALPGRLAGQYGGERIGVRLPMRPMPVSWTLDSDSNADFRCITPSLGERQWEVLLSDGAGTGTQAGWWLQQMFAQGAGRALLSLQGMEEADFNLHAGLMEDFGPSLWLDARGLDTPTLAAWVAWGQARNLALPPETDAAALRLAIAQLTGEVATEVATA